MTRANRIGALATRPSAVVHIELVALPKWAVGPLGPSRPAQWNVDLWAVVTVPKLSLSLPSATRKTSQVRKSSRASEVSSEAMRRRHAEKMDINTHTVGIFRILEGFLEVETNRESSQYSQILENPNYEIPEK